MKKFKKFEPLSFEAETKVNELIKRGGRIITEKREYIEISRLQSIAKIDQHGRVEWRQN